VAALKSADLADALSGEGPFTVFAPTDAAFKKFCDERDFSKTQLLELMEEQLPEVLKYHVVAGSALMQSDIKDGELQTMQKYAIDVDAGKLDTATITGADMKVSNGVIHVVDEVLVPPFLVPAKNKALPDIVKWGEGWGAEVLNGRLAMLGFVYAVGGEFSEGKTVLGQMFSHFPSFAFAIALWSVATAAPGMNSTIGYTADPNSMKGSKEWRTIMKGGPWPMIEDIFTPELEKMLGYAAMAGYSSLILIELVMGKPLF
jgi:hypothetical protein